VLKGVAKKYFFVHLLSIECPSHFRLLLIVSLVRLVHHTGGAAPVVHQFFILSGIYSC
jgi:hypothetical protein